MKKINIFCLLFLFLLCFSVSAVKPLPVSTQFGGLEIRGNELGFYPFNSNFTLHFHVYNSSGFVEDQADCTIDIYDSFNSHLYKNVNLTINPGEVDYEVGVNSTVSGELGIKAYKVWCNNSEAGVTDGVFYITRNGDDPFDDNLLRVPVLLVFTYLFIALLLLYISTLFKPREKGDEKLSYLKRVFFYLGIIHIVFVGFVLSVASNCEYGFCSDINRFGPLTQIHASVMAFFFMYVLYVYAFSRVQRTTDKFAGGRK